MEIGTKSVLFGIHAFWLHPIFVAYSWWKLYGWPWDPRLWVAFAVHDLGYWGKPNMDGEEGESHIYFGAYLMYIFGPGWQQFCLRHSRYHCKQIGAKPSRLCFADKMAFVHTPDWLYLLMSGWTGEIAEYKSAHVHETGIGEWEPDFIWLRRVKAYVLDWVITHSTGAEDTWTKTKGQSAPAATQPNQWP